MLRGGNKGYGTHGPLSAQVWAGLGANPERNLSGDHRCSPPLLANPDGTGGPAHAPDFSKNTNSPCDARLFLYRMQSKHLLTKRHSLPAGRRHAVGATSVNPKGHSKGVCVLNKHTSAGSLDSEGWIDSKHRFSSLKALSCPEVLHFGGTVCLSGGRM